MPKLAIVGMFEVAPGRRDQLVAALMAHRTRCLRDEPGTLRLEVMTPHDDEEKVHVFEIYRDDTAFDTHRAAPSIARFREETAGMMVKLHVTRCALVE